MTNSFYGFGLRSCAIIALLQCVPARSASPGEEKALSWTAHHKPALLNSFQNIGAVTAFLRTILPHDDLINIDVARYTFADLGADGHLELVAGLSGGAKGSFYPTVLVVAKTKSGFIYSEAYNGGAMDVPSVDDVLVHIDTHPGLELLLPRRLGPYEGARPVAIVYDVYEFKNNRVHQANLKFGEFYKGQLLPKLRAAIKDKEAEISPRHTDIDHDVREEILAQKASVDAMEKMLQTGTVP